MNKKDKEATYRNLMALDGEPVIFAENGKQYLGSLVGSNLRKLFNVYELDNEDVVYFTYRGVKKYDQPNPFEGIFIQGSPKTQNRTTYLRNLKEEIEPFVDTYFTTEYTNSLREKGTQVTSLPKKGFSLAQSIIDDMAEKDYHADVVEKTNFHAGVEDLKIDQYSTYEDNWTKPNYGATQVPELVHNPIMVSDIRDITCFKVIKSSGSTYTVDDGISQFTCSYEFLKRLKASGSVIDCTEPMYMAVAGKYAEPERKYHNIDHIETMLHFLNQYSLGLTEHEYETLKTAILFHDVVYSYKESEVNELRSAEAYMRYIQNSPFGEKFNPEVVTLIMATKWHFSPFYQPTTKLEKFMLDADLITFTFEYSDFVHYNSLITDEVIAMLGESKKAEILKARKGFMQAIYDNDLLKFHCEFNKIAEPTAYDNIKRYLEDFDILNGE